MLFSCYDHICITILETKWCYCRPENDNMMQALENLCSLKTSRKCRFYHEKQNFNVFRLLWFGNCYESCKNT